jgi:hypothetical protein
VVRGGALQIDINSSELALSPNGGAEQLAQRFGVWEIIAARFVYGTRIASVLFWGISNCPLCGLPPLI